MVKYARMALKIGVHSLFGPQLPVEFVHFDQKYLGVPIVHATILITQHCQEFVLITFLFRG